MKSKQYVEALRAQLEKSLDLVSTKLATKFILEENDRIRVTDDLYAYGLQLTQLDNGIERRIWLRRYAHSGSLNDIKANAYGELFDIIIGSFCINAMRTDNATLQKLSNDKV